MGKEAKGEVSENLERYILLTNQYATLASVREERVKKFMNQVSKSEGKAFSQGDALKALYNVVEVDGRIYETLDRANDVLFETLKIVSGVD